MRRLPWSSNRLLQIGFPLAALALLLLYAAIGEAKPMSDWRAIDLIGEGGTAAMAAAWMWIVLESRPAGRVTLLLALGLAALALGSWADGLDEVFSMQAAPGRIDKLIESGLTPLGMALLTAGLIGWRREQFALSEHMEQRERLFRDHRAFDRITQLASTDYLREQVIHERARRPEAPAALLLLEIDGLQPLWREGGRRDAVRALRAVTHQLLLNLRRDDLLCRGAGDRLVVLLPATPEAAAERCAAHLARMVRLMSFDAGAGARPAALGLRWACTAVDADTDAGELLAQLGRRLQGSAATSADTPQPI